MKKKIITTSIILVTVLIVTACSSKDKNKSGKNFTITGTVIGIKNGWVKIKAPNYINPKAKEILIDSTTIINGKFNFTGFVKHPDMINMYFSNYTRTELMLENTSIKLNINVNKINSYGRNIETKIEGSKLNNLLTRQLQIEDSLIYLPKYAILDSIYNQEDKAYASKDKKEIARLTKLQKAHAKLRYTRIETVIRSMVAFVKSHPKSAVSPYVLRLKFSEMSIPKSEMKDIYNLLQTGDAVNTAMFRKYKKVYDKVFNYLQVGDKVSDFTLPTFKGKTVTLSKIKAKYILIDFWASWCVPCREEIQHFKKLYTKYHKDGFEIVSIGTSDSGINWKKAAKEEKLKWYSAFNGDINSSKRGSSGGELNKKYDIKFLPTTFLVTQDRKIVFRHPLSKVLDNEMLKLFGY